MSSSYPDMLHEIVEVEAEKSPASLAVEFHPEIRLTYQELNEASNRLARYINAHKRPGKDIIALCLRKNHLAAVAVIASLKAGMTWLPLPLDAPASRIHQILGACNISLILYSVNTLDSTAVATPCHDIDEVMKSREFNLITSKNLGTAVKRPHDLCHILFTSGSTGVPKGVKLDHRAVMHCVRALIDLFDLNERTRTLQFAAMTFDIFGLDLFMTLASGGCLVLASLSDMMGDMTAFIHQKNITYTQLTPSVMQLIDPAGVPALETLASSGEALPRDLADRWRHRVRLFNAYGPTETIVCTAQNLSSTTSADSMYIGEAIPGLEVCICAEQSADEVAQGEVGEICVAGPQLFRGYISVEGDTQSTECQRNEKRFYRTGDLGCWEMGPKGTKLFKCLGRRDNQVKVRGVRVDMGDVENAILASPKVMQCAAVLPKSGYFAGHLCSILTPHEPLLISEGSLNALDNKSETRISNILPIRLAQPSPEIAVALTDAKSAAMARLPKQCMPTFWYVILDMPLTQSGKIDRVKLRNWVEHLEWNTYSEHATSLPSKSLPSSVLQPNSREDLLQSLLADVLGRPAPSIPTDVSFFELGADSLDIIRFISEARKMGFEYTLSQAHALRTVNALSRLHPPEMAAVLQDEEEIGYVPFSLLSRTRPLAPILEEVATACNVPVGKIEDVYPCTPYQSGLMALDLRCPMSYICAFSWTLPKNISKDWFRISWNTLVASEPVLRNRLVWDTLAQAFWQVTISHTDLGWSKDDFDGPMSVGHSLCRGLLTQDTAHNQWNFQLRIHHSIIDGWSLKLMLNRLKSLYHREEAVPSVVAPFTHFMRLRLAEDGRQGLSSQRFWTQYLTGFTPSDFPTVPPDASQEVHATGHQSLTVRADLKEVASRYGVTPATMLYATTVLALGVHSDTEDVGFGMILSGRDAPLDGIYDMLGPAFAIVPFRISIDRQEPVKSLFQKTAQHIIDIIPHQHYGLQEIKRCGAGAAAACEFQTLVVVQPEDESLAGDGLWEKVHGQALGLADNIPLSVELVLGESQIGLNCYFDPNLISEDDCSVLLGHIREVLIDFIRIRPEDPVKQVNLATQDERSRMVNWAHQFGQPVNRCLHELLQSSFVQYSGLVALRDQLTEREYTYEELDRYTDGMSRFLRSKYNICPESIVLVALEKSASAIIAILAVLRAGGAYVPIEPSWPLERVRHIVKDTHASLVLCSPTTVRLLGDIRIETLVLSALLWSEQDPSLATSHSSIEVTPCNVAVVMYTSGSTGVPKGVMLEHRALSTSLTYLARDFALKPGTRYLHFSSFVFDASILDIFIPLLSGACVCVPDEHSRINRLSLTMKELKIEAASLTPSTLDLIAPEDATSLRVVLIGGEMARKSLIKKWANRIRLINAYGPTEASIITTITDDLTESSDPTVIGRNVTSWHWIVRRDGDGLIYPVPTGCAGEIAIAGHVLARGYVHNPKLTSQNFIEAPQLAVGQMPSRIYLTGDIGRYNAVGRICIAGRRDRMTKINGVRVEPAESEYQLRLLGGIFNSCVVQCVHDAHQGPRLAAFVEAGLTLDQQVEEHGLIVWEPTPAFKTLSQDAYARLQALLPSQYVPTLFVPITRIPYLASSKVDLRLLRDELLQAPNMTSTFGCLENLLGPSADQEMPGTPAELAVEAVLRQVFAIEQRLHTSTNFFQLGGDSFAAIKLVSFIRRHGFELTISHIYKHPRLKELATMAVCVTEMKSTVATQSKKSSSSLSSVPKALVTEICSRYDIPAEEIDDMYPTSPFQEGLAAIGIDENERERSQRLGTYNASIAFRLGPAVIAERLTRAIEQVICLNPIYRTKIVHSSQGTMQVVLRALQTSGEQKQDNTHMFSYAIPQKSGASDSRLVLKIHHALYDAWTMERLIDDINLHYKQPNGKFSLPKPYRHFIDHLSTLDQEAASKYWTEQLTGAPLLAFPEQSASQHAMGTESLQLELNLNVENVQKAGIAIATVLASSVALLLSAYCNTNDVCFGMTLSGRDHSQLEDIAGPTLSTVPMRVDIDRTETVGCLLRQVQNTLLQMRQHQHYGLQNIARLPNDGARDASKFRTLFLMQQTITASSKAGREDEIIGECIHNDTSMFMNYALVIIAFASAKTGKTTFRIEYDPTHVQKSEAKRIGEQLQQLAMQCADPEMQIREVEAVSAADRLQIFAWNSPVQKYSAGFLHQIIESLADKHPDSLALESTVGAPELSRLTYCQLNEHAERLSTYIEQSIAPDATIVGFCFKKSSLAIIAMLAIWKAGRTFVVLDPAAPANRIKTIIAEVGKTTPILTEPSQLDLFESLQVIVLDPLNSKMTENSLMDSYQRLPLKSRKAPNPSDPAYILYTSGSSGAPKGVVVSYSAIAASLVDVAAVIGLNHQTRMLQFAAFTFDISLLEIFSTLVSGGCVCIPSEAERFAATITDVIVRFRINRLILTSTVAQFVEPGRIPDLQGLMLVGEPPSSGLIRKWSEIKPALPVMNGYGPTEASVQCSTNISLHESDAHNMGYASACNIFLTVPENEKQLAAVGAVGEIIICGDIVARGYLRKPEMTNQVFGINLPWMSRPDGLDLHYYRTGDLARYTSDGSMIYLGRKDLQAKIHGQRVELAEIEFQIDRSEIFLGCAVEIVHHNLLVAFVVVETLQSGDHDGPLPVGYLSYSKVEATRKFLSLELPAYMIPSVYVPVNKWPTSVSGKIDRRRLCESVKDSIETYRHSQDDQKQRPHTAVQNLLAEVWAEAMCISKDQIGLHDTIPILGGDSVAFIRFVAGARRRDLNLDLKKIYHNSSLEEVALYAEQHCQGRLANNGDFSSPTDRIYDNAPLDYGWTLPDLLQIAEACGIDKSDIADVYPCIPTQEAIIAAMIRRPESYVSREVFALPTDTDLERFKAAWERVFECTPVLRTRICSISGGRGFSLVQVVCRYRYEGIKTISDPSHGEADIRLGGPLVQCSVIENQTGRFFEMTWHHSIYDGPSIALIWDDLRFAYEHSAHPPLRPPYRKYVDHLNSSDVDGSVKFWDTELRQYEGENYPIQSSSDYIPQATLRSQRSKREPFQWERSCRYTFATVARAAWAILLSLRARTSDAARDVCFTATMSGRSAMLAGVEDIVVPTINTVPVRIQFDMDQSIDQFLGQVQENALLMSPHEHLGLGRIREIHHSASIACQSSSLLVVQQAELQIDALPAGLTRVDDEARYSEPFGLILECSQDYTRNVTSLSATYDPKLLTQKAVDHLLEQLMVLIMRLNHDCSQEMAIRSIVRGLAHDKDLSRVAAWNSEYSASPTACVHQLVEQSVKQYPRSIAIDAHDGQYTYEELDQAANALAVKLQDAYGVKRGDIIPLCFEKSKFMIVAILAVLKSGAGYTPLEIGGPMVRLEHVIRETNAKLVVVSQTQAEKHDFSAPVLIINQESFQVVGFRDHPRSRPTVHDIAYVTFTSGSTGLPKGVITEHGGAYLSIQEHGKRFQHARRGNGLRTLQFNSYVFDVSVLDIFATLAYGGCLCIPSEDERMTNLEEYIARMNINFADLTPTVASLVDPVKVPTLKGLIIGGEMAPRALITKWTSEKSPLDVFINCYGPTEASISCAAGIIDPTMGSGNVGKPLAASLWIVDETDCNNLVPISSVGELVISGPTLARGYLNDDQRTAEVFIESVPWLECYGHNRLYKTGDLARFDIDGNVEILGRKEEGQMKLRGLRIELGEIEATIMACNASLHIDRVVAARVVLHGKPTLAAFIQLSKYYRQGTSSKSRSIFYEPSEQQRNIAYTVAESLRKRLPEYMIPQLWLPVCNWPLMASKKTDRRCLMTTCEALSTAIIYEYQKSYSSANMDQDSTTMTETQAAIKNAWIKVLRKAKDVSIQLEDDFFNLGGNSLDVIKLIAELRTQDIKLNPQEIFMSRSLGGMAEIVDSKTIANLTAQTKSIEDGQANGQPNGQSWISNLNSTSEHSLRSHSDGDDSISETLTPKSVTPSLACNGQARKPCNDTETALRKLGLAGYSDIQDVMPGTHMQLNFLIEGQKFCRTYYAWWLVEIDTSCPIAHVNAACQSLVSRHEILRTRFHLLERQCFQVVVRDHLDFKVLVHDEFPSSMCERLDKDVEHAVCFGKILTRFRLLIEEGTGRQTLAMGLSHAQYDGFCLPTLLNDLFSNLMGGNISARPPLHYKYRKFIEHIEATSNENANIFWRHFLEGSKHTRIAPSATTDQPVMGQSIMRRVPYEFKHGSRHFPHSVICKAAWAIVLSQLSRSNDVVFANLVSGRFAAFEGASDIIGPCLNVVPVRTRIERDKHIRDLLQQVHEQQVATLPFETTPLDRILEQTEWPVSTRIESIFQYQHLPEDAPTDEDHNTPRLVGNAVYGGGILQHDGCWLMAWPAEDGEAVFKFTFCEETISSHRAENILDLLSTVLHAIDTGLDNTIDSLFSQTSSSTDACFPRPESIDVSPSVEHCDASGGRHNNTDQSQSADPSPAISSHAHIQPVIQQHLKSIWLQVLRPLHAQSSGPSSSIPKPASSQNSSATPSVEEILNSDIDDDKASFFTSLGGDPIAAAEAAFLCMKSGLDLSIQDFMDFPTVALQAELLTGKIRRPERGKVRLVFNEDHRYN